MAAATTTTPHVLSAAELDALPLYAPVQCTTDFGRPVLAMKIGTPQSSGGHTWRTTDGATFPDSFTISRANPILLVPAGGAS